MPGAARGNYSPVRPGRSFCNNAGLDISSYNNNVMKEEVEEEEECEKMMTSLLIRHRGERYGDTTVDRHNHFRSVITIKQATNCKQGVQPRLSAVRSNQYLISGILFQNMVEPPGSCYRCAGGRWGREGGGMLWGSDQ